MSSGRWSLTQGRLPELLPGLVRAKTFLTPDARRCRVALTSCDLLLVRARHRMRHLSISSHTLPLLDQSAPVLGPGQWPEASESRTRPEGAVGRGRKECGCIARLSRRLQELEEPQEAPGSVKEDDLCTAAPGPARNAPPTVSAALAILGQI